MREPVENHPPIVALNTEGAVQDFPTLSATTQRHPVWLRSGASPRHGLIIVGVVYMTLTQKEAPIPVDPWYAEARQDGQWPGA